MSAFSGEPLPRRKTVAQVAALHRAGSEIVRITVDRDESAAAVPGIRDRLDRLGINVPLVGDFHYIGHKLLADHPACAEALAKYRINPGNVGFKDKRDRQFSAIVEIAIKHDKPVRIGVNWGSLDPELAARLMDENARLPEPRPAADTDGHRLAPRKGFAGKCAHEGFSLLRRSALRWRSLSALSMPAPVQAPPHRCWESGRTHCTLASTS